MTKKKQKAPRVIAPLLLFVTFKVLLVVGLNQLGRALYRGDK